MTNGDAALQAAKEVLRLEAELATAKERFYALIGQPNISPSPNRTKPTGKAINPESINQRVVALLRVGAQTVEFMAQHLGATPQQVRHALVYHQKRGRVTHAGVANTYKLLEVINGNGTIPAQVDHLKP